MISVLVLEERGHLRDALGQLIAWKQPTFELAAACAHHGEARVLVDQGLKYDAVILDPSTAAGLESLRSLAETGEEAPIVGFCDRCDPELLMTFLRAGGSGLILKQEGPERLLFAVEAAVGEKRAAVFSPPLSRLLVDWVLNPSRIPRSERPEQLTPREIEVLTQLAAGQTYAEVAETLGIGIGTVQSHVKNIYRKLDVSSKTEAATLAITEGILPSTGADARRGEDDAPRPPHWTSEQTS